MVRFCLALLLLAAATDAQDQEPTIATTPSGGEIIGRSSDGVDSFLGIQYAQVGERFSRSTLVDPVAAVNASDFGSNCHQLYLGLPNFLHQIRQEEEECLYLNIWRPANSTESSSLTTMLWIHGGGFAIGSGADQVHTGANLAKDQNVLVVSINYRLGVLGLLPQDDVGTGGMNGLYDQIVALQWVQENIAAFGGDPNAVTVFGESAGGEAICMLSVSPLAKGLFHRTILQSGECINNPWAGGIPNANIASGRAMVDSLLGSVDALSISDLTNSSKFPPAELNAASLMVGWPVVTLDEAVLPQHPQSLYRVPTNIVPKDIMVGSNSYEDVTFMGFSPEGYVALTSDLEGWVVDAIEGTYGEEAALQLVDAYSPVDAYENDAVAAFAQFNGDFYIRCPVREYASIASSGVSGNVYLYNFAHFSNTDPAVHFGLTEYIDTSEWASHFAELPFVFGTLDFWTPGDLQVTDADRALSIEVQTRWANFAKTGNPNIPGFNEWEAVLSDSTTVSAATEVPTFLFRSGSGQMESIPKKVSQCSSFPYTAKAALADSSAPSSTPTLDPTSSAAGSIAKSVIITLTMLVLAMIVV